MSEDTEKLLKRKISELTSRVDELESIVIEPQPKVEKEKPDIQFGLTFEEVITAFKEDKVAARACWLNDRRPKRLLMMMSITTESEIMDVGGSFNKNYSISKDDLNAEDWVVFKNESVYDESVDKNRRKTKHFQIDVKTGKG